MTTSHAERTTLGAELRKKFKSPREALKKLGIDASVLKDPRLAFDGANTMKPNRLQYLVAKGIAKSLNPLLAADAKVDYTPLFQGLTSKNFKARSKVIVGDAKKLLKGKTIAKDASVEHLAHMLDQFEHVTEPKSLDESVSEPQHKAMEAAAHGESNIGIPKNVGEEFSKADKGKMFRDGLPELLKGKGMDDASVKEVMDGLMSDDEMPENALDEDDDAEDEKEEKDEAEDESEEEEAEDEKEEEKEPKAKDKHAKDKQAKDRAMKGNFITQDQVNAAIQAAVTTERKNSQKSMEAREFVRPWVGDLPMALDSAEKVYRAAATALSIEGADDIHASALPTLIKMQPRPGSQSQMAHDSREVTIDSASAKGFNERFPGAARIGVA